MPIYSYLCTDCDRKTEVIKAHHNKSEFTFCKYCGGVARKIPSVTGYRRDKTVNP